MQKLLILLLIFPSILSGQTVFYNMVDLYKQGSLIVQDERISVEKEGSMECIYLDEKLKGKAILLPVPDFSKGKITIVARGKDVFQGSFLRIAFHALNDSIFDLVYCRPFNFRTTDSLRSIHMIQYAYFPTLDWQILRTKYSGIYEKGIENPPEADAWFEMTLEITEKEVNAFINSLIIPSLVVNKLNNNSIGKVGIFGTNAYFESVQIQYANK